MPKRLYKCRIRNIDLAHTATGVQHREGVSNLVLAHHLTIITESIFLVHFVHSHACRLCSDIAHLITFFSVIVHGTFVAAFATSYFALTIGVEEDTKTSDADATEDAEDVALVLVEFGWGFAAEDKEVVAEESLHAGQAEVGQAWAVVEECVYALVRLA
jgi:hypothetical protein